MKKAYIGKCVLEDRILQRGCVVVSEDKILSVSDLHEDSPESGFEIVDLGGSYIAPGFIDMHVHGALGRDILDGDPGSLKSIASFQARHGVTGFVGATMAAPADSLVSVFEEIKKAPELELDSTLLGVYLEGPYVNVNKKGAHNSQFVGSFSEEDTEKIFAILEGLTALICLAPEIPQFKLLIPEVRKRGFIPVIGHSEATFAQAQECFLAGVSHATHLFNAMREFHHREPGVIGAVLDSSTVTAEIIADGKHVHPAAIRIALSQLGVDRICLVTDSIKASGLGDGLYEMEGSQIFVEKEKAVLLGSNALAGSVVPLNSSLRNLVQWCGLKIYEAVRLVTSNPARVLGLGGKAGRLAEGYPADLVAFDERFTVNRTIHKGREVFSQTAFE